MKTAVIGKVLVAGRVLLGPKQVGVGYARIVAVKDGSGRIECYDQKTASWAPAPPNLTFNEVWAAETVMAPDVLARIGSNPG